MRFTKSSLVALAAAQVASAHTILTNIFVDGVNQGPGICVRTNTNPSQASYPIESLSSNNMACGIDGTKPLQRICPIKDGSTLTFEYRSWANDPTKPRLDPSHKGPCAVYLKKVESAQKDTAAGNGWFKVWEEGFDQQANKWCTEKMIDNGGFISLKLPSGLQGGDYLIRSELLALHNAPSNDPQFYVGCAQAFIESSGNLVPESTVSIPGYVKDGEPSVAFNIYKKPMALPYPIPGPALASLVSGSASAQAQTAGLKPAGCIVENGDWCGFEVPDYTNEKGCWDAGENCWAQSKKCWDTVPITGGEGCKIMDARCKSLNDACKAKQFTGPPAKGKDLNPVLAKHTPKNVYTAIMGKIGGGGNTSPATQAPAPAPAPAPAQSSSSRLPRPNPSTATTKVANVENNKPTPTATTLSTAYIAPGPKETTTTINKPSPIDAAIPVEQSPAPTPSPQQPQQGQGEAWFTLHETVVVVEEKYVTVDVFAKREAAAGRHARRHLGWRRHL